MHHALFYLLLEANLHIAPGPLPVVGVPAIIVFPQAQVKSIRSVGMVCFQKDDSRVPGQAGPAHGVSVGLPSVRVAIPLKAGF